MDAKRGESVQNVVATMAISDMHLSEEFISQLAEVDEGKISSEELRQKVIQKYANCGSDNISLHSIEEKLRFTLFPEMIWRFEKVDENKNLRYLMDESDAPFREDEYTRTLEDDIVLLNIVKRDGLELDPESRLYKLGKKLNML